MAATHLVFDVNETLLDLSPLDALFADIFGDPRARRDWFNRLLHWSTVVTLTDRFVDFTTLAEHALCQLAAERDCHLSDTARARVFDAIAHLPPHAEAVTALEKLSEAGFSLTALTNSAQATVDAQFRHAGLTHRFDYVLSVAPARCYKPHPKAYAVAIEALGVAPGDLRLIAAHDWDTSGAMHAGLRAAFVARGHATRHASAARPDIVASDLLDCAAQIIAADTSGRH
ncbi:haloacid dehalogenase type II [Salinisphaera sp. Q1T1-3]|uniref:haloacid dehalogenase type II n=1 Tax=Salinisphaera sp. Q1T1-3 TaxID=2321229 RepID=UPI000E72EDA8|nr:haloacid dehalogenase type II [Salinisphaera sp. Q1T1-3]RJS95002.1 haloacid dehalogenase type II [Salinisphaera sp. Q1T1-3]